MAQVPAIKLPEDLSLLGLIRRLNLERQAANALLNEPSTGVAPVPLTGPLWFNPDNTFDVGLYTGLTTGNLRPAFVNVATAIRIGDNAASTGQIRIRNNASIRFRDGANAADVVALQVTSGDIVELGGDGADGVRIKVGAVEAAEVSATTFTVRVDLSVLGNTTLGDTTGDTITATARFASDLIPSTNGTRDLGTITGPFAWRNIQLSTGGVITFGTSGAASSNGLIRFRNNESIMSARNAANTLNHQLIIYDNSNFLIFGSTSVSRVRLSAASGYWDVASGSWLPQTHNTQDIGSAGNFVRRGYYTNLSVNGLDYTWPSSQSSNRVLRNSAVLGTLTWSLVDLSTDVTGALPIANGGTQQNTVNLGELLYGAATDTWSRLAGNSTATIKYLTQTGTGLVSAAPVWSTLTAAPADLSGFGADGGYLRSNGSAWVRVSGVAAADVTPGTFDSTFGSGDYIFPSDVSVTGVGFYGTVESGWDTDLIEAGDTLYATTRLAVWRAGSGAVLKLGSVGGTIASASATPNGQALGVVSFRGHDNVTQQTGGSFTVSATETWTASARGVQFALATTLTGTTTLVNSLILGGMAGNGAVIVPRTLRVGTSSDASLDVSVWADEVPNATAVTVYGIRSDPSFPATTTTQGHAIYTQFLTVNSAFTMTNGHALFINSPSVGAASTVTTGHGLRLDTQTWPAATTTAYGIRVGNVSGAATNIALQTGTGQVRFGDDVVFSSDNADDFGASGATRPRTGYFGTSIVIGTDPTGTQALRVGGLTHLLSTTANQLRLAYSTGQYWDFNVTSVAGLELLPTGTTFNLALFAAGSYGSGKGVVFLANATTVPSTNPTGGGVLYAEGGALKWRGSGGTTTVLAAA